MGLDIPLVLTNHEYMLMFIVFTFTHADGDILPYLMEEKLANAYL